MPQKKVKVLLLSLPYKPNYMRNARCDFVSWSGCQWYPIQLGHLGAFLEGKGYDVSIIDAPAYGLTEFDTGAMISYFKPDYIVIYAGRESFEADLAMAERLNKICPTKLAGVFYSLCADQYKVAGIEGCLEDGVLSWLEGRADSTKPIVGEDLTSEQLDEMPYVSAFFQKHLSAQFYVTPSEPHPFVDIMTARGCSYGACSFCLWAKKYTKKYTKMSMNRVMDEVKYIQKYTPYRSIMIQDDTFGQERAKEFCEAKLAQGLKITWSCYARADMSFEVLKLMKKAGCLNLHVGYESGSEFTLKRINKGLTLRQMEEFTYNAKKAGLCLHGDFMIGIDETESEIRKTIEWACKLRPHTAQFQIYIPFFGEPYFEREHLVRLAQYAYRKFYSNPKSWGAVVRQLGKPRILQESIKSIFRRRDD